MRFGSRAKRVRNHARVNAAVEVTSIAESMQFPQLAEMERMQVRLEALEVELAEAKRRGASGEVRVASGEWRVRAARCERIGEVRAARCECIGEV